MGEITSRGIAFSPWFSRSHSGLERRAILESGLFDCPYYLERYPDADESGVNPVDHYLAHGTTHDPTPHFRSSFYLNSNPDVAASGINPFAHFLIWGGREGRDPNPYFHSRYYLDSNPELYAAEVNPLAHFLLRGRRVGRMPGPRIASRVDLYATCWNEAPRLKYFFRHYDPIVARYVIYDDGSTDGTLDILRGHPKVELRDFVRSVPDSFVFSERGLFDHCWKESRGSRHKRPADWVIVCNIDEHLVHPDLGVYLDNCRAHGITAIPAVGYQMFTDVFPEADEMLADTRARGRYDRDDCKLILFSPTMVDEINYEPGGHVARPSGTVIAPAREELMLLNYQILGFDYTLCRFAELRSGLGSGDRARNFGHHYDWSRSDLERLRADILKYGVDTTDLRDALWKNGVRPDWWRTLSRKTLPTHTPLVSIVTTVYDRVDCLGACLRSVRCLDCQDYEHIIVADHPSDDVFFDLAGIVAGAKDSRISLHNLPVRTDNFGLAPAEHGLRYARGKYLCFLDDDNAFLPEHLNSLIDCLESEPAVGFAFSSCLWNGERILESAIPQFTEIDLGQTLFRREIFHAILKDTLDFRGYDWDWALIDKFLRDGVRYRHFNEKTFVFRLNRYPVLAARFEGGNAATPLDTPTITALP